MGDASVALDEMKLGENAEEMQGSHLHCKGNMQASVYIDCSYVPW